MSAFIVEDKTINRVVSHLEWDRDGQAWTMHRLEKEGLPIISDELGQAMFALNVEAVEQRYGEGEAKEFRDLNYRYSPQNAKIHQVLKSLRCWIYQCSEGSVPETPLFQIMDEYSSALALIIVSDMPEYERANWA